MSKLFTVAGTSSLDGIVKFRVANGTAAARVKVLEKNGHTDINLQDLPKAMSKEDAMSFLGYTEGAAVKVVAKTKVKVAKVTVKAAPAVQETKTPAEVQEVKQRNLETLRRVAKGSWAEYHATAPAKRKEMLAEVDKWMGDFGPSDMPKFLHAELGIKL